MLLGLLVMLELLLRAEEGGDQAACQVGRVGQGDGSTKVGRRPKLSEKYFIENWIIVVVSSSREQTYFSKIRHKHF